MSNITLCLRHARPNDYKRHSGDCMDTPAAVFALNFTAAVSALQLLTLLAGRMHFVD